MVTLDWLFIGVLFVSMVIGAWRGLVFELVSLAGWFIAVVMAVWLAADAATLLPVHNAGPVVQYALGFALVFVVSLFACGLLAWIAKKAIGAIGLRPTDRALGSIFGILRGAAALVLLALAVGMSPWRDAPWWREAQLVPVFEYAAQGLQPLVPENLRALMPPQGQPWLSLPAVPAGLPWESPR
jgi:membrane protein required for colicin V production